MLIHVAPQIPLFKQREMHMMKAYSQRLLSPFSGVVQVLESDQARALSMDGQIWEVQILTGDKHQEGPGYAKFQSHYRSVGQLSKGMIENTLREGREQHQDKDERVWELITHLATVRLPFPMVDRYECWVLDAKDETPLAMVFSCVDESQTETFPSSQEWMAIPAAMMPIERTQEELDRGDPPINVQMEQLIRERASLWPKTRWFDRNDAHAIELSPLLLTQQWQDEASQDICRRYLARMSPRLLMLHDLSHEQRLSLEQDAARHVQELARFYPAYPEVADPTQMNVMRVEAMLRNTTVMPDEAKT